MVFRLMWVPKLLLTTIKSRIFGKFGVGIFGQILAFLAYLTSWPTKTDAHKVPRWFSLMWVPKLLLLLIKIRNFGPKTTKFP